MKTCGHCGIEKPLHEYAPHKGGRDGRRAQCRACYRTNRNRHYRENLNGMKDKQLARFKERGAEQRIKREYGLEPYELQALICTQGGYCAICGILMDVRPGVRTKYRMVIDHCHSSGKTRFLLCNVCNLGLGHFQDNAKTLASAIEYLAHTK